jgi:hypothetical protein
MTEKEFFMERAIGDCGYSLMKFSNMKEVQKYIEQHEINPFHIKLWEANLKKLYITTKGDLDD